MPSFKPATLQQREEFYRYEFEIEKVEAWFQKNHLPFPQLCAVDMGSETGIIKDESKKNTIINIKAQNIKEKSLKYLPEDLYYDRNQYKDPKRILKELDFKGVWNTDNFLGQQLAFDIDPENIPCTCKNKFPHFCDICMTKTINQALALSEMLMDQFHNIGFVYSGRGMHVHVFDKEAFALTLEQRENLNGEAKKFNIDPWVSKGYVRLMRMPYSLNGLVSRTVTPLTENEVKKFDPLTSKKIIPKFLQE